MLALFLVPDAWGYIIINHSLLALVLLLLVPQFFLPLLLPGRIGLVIGLLLYAVAWGAKWSQHLHMLDELEAAGKDYRDYVVDLLYMLSNVCFVVGLVLRLLLQGRRPRQGGDAKVAA